MPRTRMALLSNGRYLYESKLTGIVEVIFTFLQDDGRENGRRGKGIYVGKFTPAEWENVGVGERMVLRWR